MRPDRANQGVLDPTRISANDRLSRTKNVGTTLKKLLCVILVLLLAGCIPIGLKTSSLPYASLGAWIA
jgi:hypothetical protein